jgi:hypothetical protein
MWINIIESGFCFDIFNAQFSNYSIWSFSLKIYWTGSNYICFFWYNIDIKTEVNWNLTTSTLLFFGCIDEPWGHTVWYYSIPTTTKTKQKPLSIILIHKHYTDIDPTVNTQPCISFIKIDREHNVKHF